ncbi:MAG: phosphoribosylamine--glycine ligase [Deltaproteobacteria bacterium]|nr:phosphoribosylamine--glycine ligase [Deltaproteobacteria bacterium]
MNILLVGSGGREHALAWKIRQNPQVTNLDIAPGNGGTALVGRNVAINDGDVPSLVDYAVTHAIDLVVAGPELPLVLGLANALREVGIPCFGPDGFAAQLEGSKAFAKTMMRETGVPTADFRVFDDHAAALAHVREHPLPLVIKADGLAAGKGVVIAQTLAEAEDALNDMMIKQIFGPAGMTVVVEEALTGEEASFLAFCDGHAIVAMPSLQDHKRIGDNDTGLNTGGMGAYSPAPVLREEDYPAMAELCIRPIVDHLAKIGHPFKGILYAGLMMTTSGPMILEYNVRFGDPECQPLMSRLESDLVEIMMSCVQGTLKPEHVRFRPETSCCVVMAAKGYPQAYPRGMRITGIEDAETMETVNVFQAGTKLENGVPVTTGGRVLGVTALGADLAEARDRAYQAVKRIHFENSYYRTDIADKGLRRSECHK